MTFPVFPQNDVDLDSSYDFDSDINVDFSLDSDVNSYLNVDHSINACVDIDGNEATFSIDLQAYGDNTAVDLNLVVSVQEGEWSSITTAGYAAAS